MNEIFYFLGGKIVPHPSSNKTGSSELHKSWEFPEPYKHLNHPTWKNLKLEQDWNFIHLVIDKIENTKVTLIEDIGVHREKFEEIELDFSVDITNNQCTISKYPSPQYYGAEDDFLKLYDCRNTNKKETVLKVIYSFIDWYKNNKL